jgi:hypothetical protein
MSIPKMSIPKMSIPKMSIPEMSIPKRYIIMGGKSLGDRQYYGNFKTDEILKMSYEQIRESVALLQMEYATHFIHCINDTQHPYRKDNVAYHRVLLALGLWKEHWLPCTCV